MFVSRKQHELVTTYTSDSSCFLYRRTYIGVYCRSQLLLHCSMNGTYRGKKTHQVYYKLGERNGENENNKTNEHQQLTLLWKFAVEVEVNVMGVACRVGRFANEHSE